MSMLKVVFRMLDKAGLTFVEPRREDGHGSSVSNLSHMQPHNTAQDPLHVSIGTQPIYTIDAAGIEYNRFAGTVTSAGDTILVTPTLGKRIRLQWVYAINDPAAATSTKLTIKLGEEIQYVAWAISKRQQLTGPIDGPLILNLSASGDVAVTIFYQEVD